LLDDLIWSKWCIEIDLEITHQLLNALNKLCRDGFEFFGHSDHTRDLSQGSQKARWHWRTPAEPNRELSAQLRCQAGAV